MSEQLEAKIDEVERKRQELEETIRRVGDAFASGLDRSRPGGAHACSRRSTPARPRPAARWRWTRASFAASEVGTVEGELERALEAAEKARLRARPDGGQELLEGSRATPSAEPDAPARRRRGAPAHRAGDAARLGSSATAASTSASSRSPATASEFTREEEELLEYLAGQAVVSIENASLHETVQRQAVTDELTGLANVRELHVVLDREIERSRRFASPLGLVMLDIDDFKQVNDRYGHQQGDEVLAAGGVACCATTRATSTSPPATAARSWLWCCRRPTPRAPSPARRAYARGGRARCACPRSRQRECWRSPRASAWPRSPSSADDKGSLIAAADAALYRAKRGGKNRVERAGRSMPEPGLRPPR